MDYLSYFINQKRPSITQPLFIKTMSNFSRLSARVVCRHHRLNNNHYGVVSSISNIRNNSSTSSAFCQPTTPTAIPLKPGTPIMGMDFLKYQKEPIVALKRSEYPEWVNKLAEPMPTRLQVEPSNTFETKGMSGSKNASVSLATRSPRWSGVSQRPSQRAWKLTNRN